MSQFYAGWMIQPPVRQELLRMCPPLHPEVRCEHVTFQFVKEGAPPPPEAQIIVRGMFYDENVQALVVQVNGIVVRPHDGFLFHVTVSHIPQFPSAFTGRMMQEKAQLVKEIAPYPLHACLPFVRRIGG
jgi:hypothetical protein